MIIYAYKLNNDTFERVAVIEARGHRIEVDPDAKTVTYDGVVAPLERVGEFVKLRILLDVTSIEIFIGDGSSQISKCFVPEDENDAPILRVKNVKGVGVVCFPMKSVWN